MEEVFVAETKGFGTLQIWWKTWLIFFQIKNKAETGCFKSKIWFKGGCWNCSQWTINHSAHAQLCSHCIEEKVSDGNSCGCVCQRGSYCCLLAALSCGMLESTLFRNQCVGTILSYLSQNIVPAPLENSCCSTGRKR